MENPAISIGAKITNSPEESSWTFYIQGFMCENDDQISSFSSDYETPSLISDASSSPVKKFKNNCTDGIYFSSGKSNIGSVYDQNGLIKKQKSSVLAVDFDLEDTASSPVNSPKISYMNDLIMNEKEKGKMDVVAEVKRNIFAKGQRDTDYTGLKKRTCN
ncbi:hypothetical protein DH2020_008657 [Rehmannia glutinosa]|uniref:Uncharacterized protein n=1 Tax=Rehmannia glutinosa TaxID=99300 RepID=A0ABR0X784_REHGL